MGVTALVMAGGKGTRMRIAEEKPLIKVCGKPVIEYVLAALKNAKKIDTIIVATTSCTPKTTKLMKQLGSQSYRNSRQRLCFRHGLRGPNAQVGRFFSHRR